MNSAFCNVMTPEDNGSSIRPIASKFDLSAGQESLIEEMGAKRKFPSEGHDELLILHKKPKLTPAQSTQAGVEQPHPTRNVALKDALFHIEQVAHSTEPTNQPLADSELVNADSSDSSVIHAERGAFGPPARVSYKDLRLVRRYKVHPYRKPDKSLGLRSDRKCEEICRAAELMMPVVDLNDPRGPYFSRPGPPSPPARQHTPSFSELNKDYASGEDLYTPTPPPQVHRTLPPEPERTPTPPHQYASALIRQMMGRFGPDWEPMEVDSDDEGVNVFDLESVDESEMNWICELTPADPANLRAFFDDVERWNRGESLTGGAIVSWRSPLQIPSPRPAFSEEELLEFGDEPTVRLVPQNTSTAPVEPEEPLPFHGPDGALLSRFTSLNMACRDDHDLRF